MDHTFNVMVLVVQSQHFTILYLVSVETIASSTTQLMVVQVVHIMHQAILYIASIASSTTQHTRMVV